MWVLGWQKEYYSLWQVDTPSSQCPRQLSISPISSRSLKLPLLLWHQLVGFHREILGHWPSFISWLVLLPEKWPPFDGIHNGLIQMEGTWGALAGSTASFLPTPHHLCTSGLGHPQKTQPSRSWGQVPGSHCLLESEYLTGSFKVAHVFKITVAPQRLISYWLTPRAEKADVIMCWELAVKWIGIEQLKYLFSFEYWNDSCAACILRVWLWGLGHK